MNCVYKWALVFLCVWVVYNPTSSGARLLPTSESSLKLSDLQPLSVEQCDQLPVSLGNQPGLVFVREPIASIEKPVLADNKIQISSLGCHVDFILKTSNEYPTTDDILDTLVAEKIGEPLKLISSADGCGLEGGFQIIEGAKGVCQIQRRGACVKNGILESLEGSCDSCADPQWNYTFDCFRVPPS